jgi:hypothetical protein
VRRLALVLTVGAALMLIPAAALAGGAIPRVAGDCLHEQYKPKAITLACGDGSSYITRLTWSRWSSTSANGSGLVTVNAGSGPPFDAYVKVSRPERCAHQRYHVFTRLTATNSGVGKTYQLFCPER